MVIQNALMDGDLAKRMASNGTMPGSSPNCRRTQKGRPEERPLMTIRETEINRLLLPAPRCQAKCAEAGGEEKERGGLGDGRACDVKSIWA